MRAAPALLVLVSLAACGRSEEATKAAPPPAAEAPAESTAANASASVDFRRPINLLGNEPFWGVQIRPDSLTFRAPDREDLKVPNPGPSVVDGKAVWIADAGDQPLTATLTVEVCQDGMSGLLYPFTAEVEVDGRVLTGCAAYADAMPREGD